MPEILGTQTGTVLRLRKDYGFIAPEAHPEQDVYFKPSWYHGSPPLQEGDKIEFEVVAYGEDLQAKDIRRVGEQRLGEIPGHPAPLIPGTDRLYDWAYLGYLPNVLSGLQALALEEDWGFRNQPNDPDKPFPILYSYLFHTYERLVLEQKVVVGTDEKYAAFNTGLVDKRYEKIYAIFARNNDPRTPWQLSNFCIAGEGPDGQNLVRYFNPLPSSAHYFDQPADLRYDARVGKPELDWTHIVIERIDRYPLAFIEDNCPSGFELQDTSNMTLDVRKSYHDQLGEAISNDSKAYRRIMNRVRDAVDLSIKRVSWNFKTAVPQYYPHVKRLQLLLPLCLLSDDHVDLALAVEKTDSGNYLGHTVLPLNWAFRNARLICRPDSDWLEPEAIDETDLPELY